MEIITNTIKSYLSSAIAYAILMLALGLTLLFFPEFSLDVIRWVLSIALLGLGLYKIISDFTRNTHFGLFSGSLGGVVLAVMGLVIMFNPDVLRIIPIVIGIWFIASSLGSLRFTLGLKGGTTSGFILSILASIIGIVCGVALIISPFSSLALTAFIGIIVTIYAAASIIDLIVLRTHLRDLSQYAKNHGIINVKSKVKK